MKRSRVLDKIADSDKRIESYHVTPENHCLLLDDNYIWDSCCGTILGYTVKDVLFAMKAIHKKEEKSDI
jgi:hypothetical protein